MSEVSNNCLPLPFRESHTAIAFVAVASLTFWLADYIQTFESEVFLIWWHHAEWTSVQYLWFLSRYLPFLDLPIALAYRLHYGLSLTSCKALWAISFFAFYASGSLANSLLGARVVALSGQKFYVVLFAKIYYVGVQLSVFILSVIYLNSLKHEISPNPVNPGCIITDGHDILLSVIFALMMGQQFVFMVIALWMGAVRYRNAATKSRIFVTFQRDGICCFIVLTLIATTNIVVHLVRSPEYQFLLVLPLRIMHSIISTRTVLNMRESTCTGGGLCFTAALVDHPPAERYDNEELRLRECTIEVAIEVAKDVMEDKELSDRMSQKSDCACSDLGHR
ncbi:hypothetical protein CC1G_03028 [Coprinopsis cinerea okayama7|uniref:DUF6533 domain-containing protein n=1 Tax=Coprinopsis cinerea (strain Okayama-7 / 130 / ATCC MYA-4618 / FGSC 9003) TaxID=240176 RepID=A8NS52_COPC7|nr:hypothetical protein CC1G_03028 [Coprinopsis cinerea okayama7\|eukprot:XP_001835940.2 hypothetical protein CC1G_03028 [Coprinopsis cinerea okayama7\